MGELLPGRITPSRMAAVLPILQSLKLMRRDKGIPGLEPAWRRRWNTCCYSWRVEIGIGAVPIPRLMARSAI